MPRHVAYQKLAPGRPSVGVADSMSTLTDKIKRVPGSLKRLFKLDTISSNVTCLGRGK